MNKALWASVNIIGDAVHDGAPAGIEGRISVLFRGRGMKRCLAEGNERFELWVGAAVLANNLMKIASLLAKRSSRRRSAA